MEISRKLNFELKLMFVVFFQNFFENSKLIVSLHRFRSKDLDVIYRAFSSAGSEHLPYKQRVGGSNPSTPTSNRYYYKTHIYFGRLAQLVQSICLTSRGSAVRIRQRPQ